MKSEINMAYAAGLMDGDGSFSIGKLKGASGNPLYFPLLQCSSWRPASINILKDMFGGTILIKNKYIRKDGEKGKPLHCWRLRSSENVAPVLKELIPFLVTKKERAQYLLDFINSFEFVRGLKQPLEKIVEKERMYLKMIKFNDYTSFSNTVSTKKCHEVSTNPLFWSYMAGLMDTDGSFSIKKQTQNKGTHVKNARYVPIITFVSTDARSVNYIIQNISFGKLYLPKNKSTSNGFHYQFGIYSKEECSIFLEKLLPFLKAKTENAKILLHFCKNSANTKYCKAGISQEELAFRDHCYQNLVHMNEYGVYKFPLIDLELHRKDADNKGEGISHAERLNEETA